MVKQEHPYVAMVNQKFHRTYIDCVEFGAEPGSCCVDCLGDKKTMLDAPAQMRIYKAPPTPDGHNVDWAMNLEGVVCCKHVHLTFLDREEWVKLANKYHATPFFTTETEMTYELDADGHAVIHNRRGSGNTHKATRKMVEVRDTPPQARAFNKTVKCQFCSTQHAIFGDCPKCFPSQVAK